MPSDTAPCSSARSAAAARHFRTASFEGWCWSEKARAAARAGFVRLDQLRMAWPNSSATFSSGFARRHPSRSEVRSEASLSCRAVARSQHDAISFRNKRRGVSPVPADAIMPVIASAPFAR